MTNLLRPGDRLTQDFDIRILEKIAEGGMGEVYEAMLHGSRGFEKRLAVKVVRADFLAGGDATLAAALEGEFLERLVAEAKLVSNLIHTHIVQIYLLGTMRTQDGKERGYIAMEYVHGINLRGLLDRLLFDHRFLPVELAVYIASRVARALEYAHAARDKDGVFLGIVHRDVSPTNILISAEGVVKLSDFGIARVRRTDAETNDYVVGKRRYMPPEQASGGPIDHRADLYSLGLVLYEMLTNRLPDRNLPVALPSALNAAVPPEVEEIVMRATRRVATERFATSADLAVALEKAIYGRGYGPTFVTLAEYVQSIFPGLARSPLAAGVEERTEVFQGSRAAEPASL